MDVERQGEITLNVCKRMKILNFVCVVCGPEVKSAGRRIGSSTLRKALMCSILMYEVNEHGHVILFGGSKSSHCTTKGVSKRPSGAYSGWSIGEH
mmetsp:Transcript_18357/g.37200  ORF Transcript_18357/g.37200 Transcript_18357/m.37200 type:complete len:95 (-) Transcript_18357:13-297(-)